jgi:hypothetical protein
METMVIARTNRAMGPEQESTSITPKKANSLIGTLGRALIGAWLGVLPGGLLVWGIWAVSKSYDWVLDGPVLPCDNGCTLELPVSFIIVLLAEAAGAVLAIAGMIAGMIAAASRRGIVKVLAIGFLSAFVLGIISLSITVAL